MTVRRQIVDTAIVDGTLVLEGRVERADLGIREGRIVSIGNGNDWSAENTLRATGLHVMPGVVDPHTHWATSGDFRRQSLRDSRAAALGGTTTALVLHRMPTDGFKTDLAVASASSYIDFAITPSITSPAHAEQVAEMLTEESPSLKFFLAYRNGPGAPPGDDWNELDDSSFEKCLQEIGHHDGAVACVHAEDSCIINRAMATTPHRNTDGLAAWARGNPREAESEAIRYVVDVATQTNATIYFVHLSGRHAVEELIKARDTGARVFGETGPHYLYHNSDSDQRVKFSPPVRDEVDRQHLWAALRDGDLQTVGSDNSTTAPSEKSGSVWEIRRGGPNAGFILPVILSEGVAQERIDLVRAAEITSTNAAKIFGLYPRKGTISIGSDADLALVDLAREVVVTPDLLHLDGDLTLFDGQTFRGWPVGTMLRGELLSWAGEVLGRPGQGKPLVRSLSSTLPENIR